MKLIRLGLVGMLVLISSSAWAGVRVGLHYMPGYTQPIATGVTAGGALNLLGFGSSLGYQFGASEVFGLSLEGGYVTRNIMSGATTLTGTGIYGAFGPRISIKKWLNFFAGGGYFFGLTTPGAPFNGAPSSFVVSGGIDFDIPIIKVMAITIGARFVYPFVDVAPSAASTVAPSMILGQVGLRFGTYGK